MMNYYCPMEDIKETDTDSQPRLPDVHIIRLSLRLEEENKTQLFIK